MLDEGRFTKLSIKEVSHSSANCRVAAVDVAVGQTGDVSFITKEVGKLKDGMLNVELRRSEACPH